MTQPRPIVIIRKPLADTDVQIKYEYNPELGNPADALLSIGVLLKFSKQYAEIELPIVIPSDKINLFHKELEELIVRYKI